jgi:hypothetical protein
LAIALHPIDYSEVVVGGRVCGIEFQSLLKLLFGVIKPAFVKQRYPEVVVVFGTIGPNWNRMDGLLGASSS